jgi:SAM-dependent methyltransferase
MTHYDALMAMPSPAPPHWAEPCTHQECSLHQLSPYIGKLKSSIAQDLILKYSRPGELVVDMFCGSGTVPLEAARLGRRVFASDASIYAVTLTQGKLQAPMTNEAALAELEDLLRCVESLPVPDLRCVPRWIRAFFHPHTLKEALRFTEFLQRQRKNFLLASMLGILHHQRPGFLSFPSSHLVPYLRSKKFPQADYPDLYTYRPLAPRLRAKVERALKRPPTQADVSTLFRTQTLMGLQRPFIDQWREIAIRGMTALTVIEHFDVFKHCCLGVCVHVKFLQVDQLGL